MARQRPKISQQVEAFPALARPAEVIQVANQDSLQFLRSLPADSIDSVISDPPYGMSELSLAEVRRALASWLWGQPHTGEKAGYLGQTWDSFVPGPELWSECLRVLRPGGYLCAFASSRTQDLMALAIRLAGFTIVDELAWFHVHKMPKGADIAKAIDKSRGHWRGKSGGKKDVQGADYAQIVEYKREKKGAAVSPVARQHEGRHTQIRQAYEPIIQAIKPYEGPAYANVMAHGTGALNVSDCMVRLPKALAEQTGQKARWPSNVLLERAPSVVAPLRQDGQELDRYFYSPVVRGDERLHETQKPVDLMRWLVRLHTPVRGVVLDPFAGSGTTGIAALEEDRYAILVERDQAKFAAMSARVKSALETRA